MTSSGRVAATALARESCEATSPGASFVPGGPEPGRRVSAATAWPPSSSCLQTEPPRNPLAPVTSAFTGSALGGLEPLLGQLVEPLAKLGASLPVGLELGRARSRQRVVE